MIVIPKSKRFPFSIRKLNPSLKQFERFQNQNYSHRLSALLLRWRRRRRGTGSKVNIQVSPNPLFPEGRRRPPSNTSRKSSIRRTRPRPGLTPSLNPSPTVFRRSNGLKPLRYLRC